ncbi:hypothetical protein PLEOSDRAFT_61618 [Pleurotus ostreatus PC15]|uniref:Major facilitator superfamily (MFS) profile domain-containing protein n=1 Tax=Pleurotus ostreatus (strain PC15) TaxID=1137138 RepID=A0A067NX80_PLEO1|nr:hypothetical protein PLEOSDRAFT_61618 [Pleurotus ostreatus PC15]
MADSKDQFSSGTDSEKNDGVSITSVPGGNDTHSQAFERRTMRLVDFRVLPLLAVVYAIALIDRINLGVARTAGMGADLNLAVGSRFSIVTCLYFIPYILGQLPGNLVLRLLGARNWLAFCVVAWGAVQLGMGFVPTWGWLILCRVLLGLFEAPFFPALVYIISTWYKRYEVQKRLAAFYLSSITISGFSPIIAYGLSLLDGKKGIAGWEWIFIIEGAITIALGIVLFYALPDFPDKNTFLTPEQTAFVLKRVEDDRGDSIPDKITFKKILTHLGDWTIWAYGVMFMCATTPAYAMSYFISIILEGMGYKAKSALLLSAPPYGPAFVSAMAFAWLSDKTQIRSPYIAIQAVIGIVGLALMAYAPQNGVRYFGTFLVNAGSSGCIPGILAYGANNVVSQSKRVVQSAVTVAFGGIGGIIASTVFREVDRPKYVPGLWVTLGMQVLIVVLVGVMNLHFKRMNRLCDEGKLGGGRKVLEGQPGFRYTL